MQCNWALNIQALTRMMGHVCGTNRGLVASGCAPHLHQVALNSKDNRLNRVWWERRTHCKVACLLPGLLQHLHGC